MNNVVKNTNRNKLDIVKVTDTGKTNQYQNNLLQKVGKCNRKY